MDVLHETLGHMPLVHQLFMQHKLYIVDEMMSILRHGLFQSVVLEEEDDIDFPSEEILDLLQAHELLVRRRTHQALNRLCVNVMRAMSAQGLLRYPVFQLYPKCYLHADDLILTKL